VDFVVFLFGQLLLLHAPVPVAVLVADALVVDARLVAVIVVAVDCVFVVGSVL